MLALIDNLQYGAFRVGTLMVALTTVAFYGMYWGISPSGELYSVFKTPLEEGALDTADERDKYDALSNKAVEAFDMGVIGFPIILSLCLIGNFFMLGFPIKLRSDGLFQIQWRLFRFGVIMLQFATTFHLVSTAVLLSAWIAGSFYANGPEATRLAFLQSGVLTMMETIGAQLTIVYAFLYGPAYLLLEYYHREECSGGYCVSWTLGVTWPLVGLFGLIINFLHSVLNNDVALIVTGSLYTVLYLTAIICQTIFAFNYEVPANYYMSKDSPEEQLEAAGAADAAKRGFGAKLLAGQGGAQVSTSPFYATYPYPAGAGTAGYSYEMVAQQPPAARSVPTQAQGGTTTAAAV